MCDLRLQRYRPHQNSYFNEPRDSEEYEAHVAASQGLVLLVERSNKKAYAGNSWVPVPASSLLVPAVASLIMRAAACSCWCSTSGRKSGWFLPFSQCLSRIAQTMEAGEDHMMSQQRDINLVQLVDIQRYGMIWVSADITEVVDSQPGKKLSTWIHSSNFCGHIT